MDWTIFTLSGQENSIEPEPELIKLIKPNMFGLKQRPLSIPHLNNLLHGDRCVYRSEWGDLKRVNNLIGEAMENENDASFN